MDKIGCRIHVLAIPYPLQGHLNPMLQLCKRLTSKGVRITLVTITSARLSVQNQFESIQIEYILDDDNIEAEGSNDSEKGAAHFKRIQIAVSDNLAKLVEEKASSGHPVNIVLYDSMMPWILEIVQGQLGLKGAAFFTQACAVSAIYNHIHRGTLKVPLETSTILLPSMPQLESNDLPSFVYNPGPYPDVLDLVLAQNINLEKSDWLLFNSFDKLENEVVTWLTERYPIKTIGPSTPSMYTDKRLKDDKDYTVNFFTPDSGACLKWLDTKETGSVVYVSFGSMSDLGENQMQEIACGLMNCTCNFLWVVRPSEESKIPRDFMFESQERGLIVNWCPQPKVLSHRAVGCFMTHCGWNSTIEALSLGVPMVTMPVWADQTTNSKYIVDVWKVGLRVKGSEEREMVTREEVERTIREVMHGEKTSELRSNALRWKELAKEANSEGGSSDKNIEEFVSSVESTHSLS
ncbi:UDP-glycosyltransferase 74E2-like [Coffea eugenioides]|uniref:UDP-glycosyltransferase 74E2-like n=1 Tax=Coffea eugenioides TaxID=49369 RepID=UPI000F6137FB|nr:UDP-glycosyltransferase 74E2-like [Coffea eugenioides]